MTLNYEIVQNCVMPLLGFNSILVPTTAAGRLKLVFKKLAIYTGKHAIFMGGPFDRQRLNSLITIRHQRQRAAADYNNGRIPYNSHHTDRQFPRCSKYGYIFITDIYKIIV